MLIGFAAMATPDKNTEYTSPTTNEYNSTSSTNVTDSSYSNSTSDYYTSSSSDSTRSSSDSSSSSSSVTGNFVGSVNSNVYHYPSCASAKRIKSHNLISFSSTTNAKTAGYRPSKKCNPPG